MKKKIVGILFTIFLLLSPLTLAKREQTYLANQSSSIGFSPEDIELKDDAFHDINRSNCAEWWYFDAILNDEYSVQVIFYVFSILKIKIAYTSLNIFKDGDPVFPKEKIYLKNFDFSTETPSIIIDGKQVMKGYINEITGEWIYDVSLEIGDSSADLQFIGRAKGWKGNVTIGGWAVILPKAYVNGTLKVNDEEINVTGEGYHDHNWNMKLRSLLNFGWYWGWIVTDNFSIVYYAIMNTRISYGQMLLIIANESSYISIKPDDMHFIASNYYFENRRLIPHSFVISADTQNISLITILSASKLYHGNSRGLRHYWRYFAESQGYITVDSKTENINGMQIAEFWRFR